jgi:hypothetical protein
MSDVTVRRHLRLSAGFDLRLPPRQRWIELWDPTKDKSTATAPEAASGAVRFQPGASQRSGNLLTRR